MNVTSRTREELHLSLTPVLKFTADISIDNFPGTNGMEIDMATIYILNFLVFTVLTQPIIPVRKSLTTTTLLLGWSPVHLLFQFSLPPIVSPLLLRQPLFQDS